MLKTNRKIANASPKEYNGIQFKSRLEVLVFKTLAEAGFSPKYESEKIIIFEGFSPKTFFFTKSRTGELKEDFSKIISITYTPDIVFEFGGTKIYIEVKGFENDLFPVKKKLFRKWLDTQSFKSMYFEVWSKKQTLQAIEIIKKYAKYMDKIDQIRFYLSELPTEKDKTLAEKFLNSRDFESLYDLVVSDVTKARVKLEKLLESETEESLLEEGNEASRAKEHLIILQQLLDLIIPIYKDFVDPLNNDLEEEDPEEDLYEDDYC